MAKIELTDDAVFLSELPETQPLIQMAKAMNTGGMKGFRLELSSGDTLSVAGKIIGKIPRGEMELRFIPRKGTANLTGGLPETPLRRPIRSVKMPKGVGAIVFVDYVQFLATEILPEVQPLIQALGEILVRYKAQQDIDLASATLAFAQVDPQAAGNRLRAACLTRTARKTGLRTHRIRGYSRT